MANKKKAPSPSNTKKAPSPSNTKKSPSLANVNKNSTGADAMQATAFHTNTADTKNTPTAPNVKENDKNADTVGGAISYPSPNGVLRYLCKSLRTIIRRMGATKRPRDEIDASLNFSMQQLIQDVPTVTGLHEFANFVLKTIKYLLEGDTKKLQNTVAIVVQNASGVGKTVGSIAVCQNLSVLAPKLLYLPLYLGFNSAFGLTVLEKNHLRDSSIDGYDRIASVVGRRLLLQLQALVRECEESPDINTALKGVLRSGEDWQAYIPLPTNMTIFNADERFPSVVNIEEKCATLIKKLPEFCGGKTLVVLVIIDEGQLLDELIRPAVGGSGGARCALRFARKIQMLTSSTKVCALPVMTGLNPETSLDQITEGSNLLYEAALHNFDEFVELVKTVNLKKEYTDHEYKMLAHVFYPVARDVEWYFKRKKNNMEMGTLPGASVPKELAPLMLMAGGVEMKLDKAIWNRAIPAKFYQDSKTFLPMPSCYRISSYIDACVWIWTKTQEQWLPIHNLGNLSELRSALSLGDDAFEATCGRVFTLILALANTPFLKSSSESAGWNETEYPFKVISTYYTSAQKLLRTRHPWFDIPCDLEKIQEPAELVGFRQVLLPSSQSGLTEKAFKLNDDGTPAYALFNSLKTNLDKLTKKGECYVLRCGGSAPVDFVYVVLLTDKVLINVNENGKVIQKWDCEVAIRLADAKHCNKKYDSDQPPPLGRSEVNDMVKRFQQVANYLYVTLEDKCGMRVVEEKSAIFTNRQPTTPIMDASITIGTTWTAATKGNHHPLSILCPKTFNFPPLTDYLYDGAAKAAAGW